MNRNENAFRPTYRESQRRRLGTKSVLHGELNHPHGRTSDEVWVGKGEHVREFSIQSKCQVDLLVATHSHAYYGVVGCSCQHIVDNLHIIFRQSPWNQLSELIASKSCSVTSLLSPSSVASPIGRSAGSPSCSSVSISTWVASRTLSSCFNAFDSAKRPWTRFMICCQCRRYCKSKWLGRTLTWKPIVKWSWIG